MQLVAHGFSEKDVLELPIDKFDLYVQEVQRSKLEERSDYISDLAMIGSVLMGGGKKAEGQYKLTLEAWTDEINHG